MRKLIIHLACVIGMCVAVFDLPMWQYALVLLILAAALLNILFD